MTGPPSGPPVTTSRPPIRKSSSCPEPGPEANQLALAAGSAQAAKTWAGGTGEVRSRGKVAWVALWFMLLPSPLAVVGVLTICALFVRALAGQVVAEPVEPGFPGGALPR